MLAHGAWSRRELLQKFFWSVGALALPGWLGRSDLAHAQLPASRFASIGPLGAPDTNGLRLPAGFRSRVVAVSGERPARNNPYVWHTRPDGGATFATGDGGWIYVSNSEIRDSGGVGVLRFRPDGRLVASYSILRDTSVNCAGGKTPWRTWLSCEETMDGQVYECNPYKAGNGVARPALGRFAHEAAAVDAGSRVLYLTEDDPHGRVYRFLPSAADWPGGTALPALREGRLQVMRLAAGGRGQTLDEAGLSISAIHTVVWEDVVDPDQPQSLVRSSLGATAPGTRFLGGEGMWFGLGRLYFATKGDNRIWTYERGAESLEVIYDFATADPETRVLSGVDNLTLSEFGDVLVAEDGGDMQLCAITPSRRIVPIVQASDIQPGNSEITGPAFSPDGKRLYFSAQRSGRNGAVGAGITFELLLPFSSCPTRACP